jgi:16S rRNA (cytosine967-C5)-methyltransferase
MARNKQRMIPAARLSSAIDILGAIETDRRPAAQALKDWGQAHRFAGAKDRAAIASLVYDGLRRRASASWLLGADSARAIMLGALRLARGLDHAAIASLCSGERFAPALLSAEENARLSLDPRQVLETAPSAIAGDMPDWLLPHFQTAFGPHAIREAAALATRAPIDIRVNTLKTLRPQLRDALASFSPSETPFSPVGLRFGAGEDGRGPSLQAQPEFLKGHFEIQDEGSQLIALLSSVEPGEQVIDLCAGGGGKTLALAAMMNNTGQIHASDIDARRLAPIHERLRRADIRNVQVHTPRNRDDDPLVHLDGKADLVLIDAPCTGTGTWRRNPDAKWRMRPGALAERIKEQDAVLRRAFTLAKPGGRIAYITCSVLAEENDQRMAACLAMEPKLKPIDPRELLALAPDALSEREDVVSLGGYGLQLSPARTQTDGFYLALLRKQSG